MNVLFQIVVNNLATKFIFEESQKVELVDKMVEIQDKLPMSKVRFIKIEL